MEPLRVGVDLDGVVYPIHEALRARLAAKRGCSIEDLPLPARQFQFHQSWDMSSGAFDAFLLAEAETGLFSDLPPVLGAVDMVKRIAAFAEVSFVSTRPTTLAVVKSTFGWVAEHEFEVSGIALVRDKRSMDMEVHLDDSLQVYEDLDELGDTSPVLLNQPWNQGPGRRVGSLDEFAEVCEVVSELLADMEPEERRWELGGVLNGILGGDEDSEEDL